MSEEECAVEFLKSVINMSKNDSGENNPFQILLNLIEKQQKKIEEAINYIKDKQKIQYKYALSQIECDELLKILEGE